MFMIGKIRVHVGVGNSIVFTHLNKQTQTNKKNQSMLLCHRTLANGEVDFCVERHKQTSKDSGELKTIEDVGPHDEGESAIPQMFL